MSPIPHIYPAAQPTISNDVLTISRFLNSPALVQRRLRTIAEQRFLADSILTGRYETQGGALLYEQTESIYTSKAPEAVNAGAEYPKSPAVPGTAAIAGITKWGQDVPITDEHVHRYGRRAVDVALIKIVNYLTKQVDATAMTLLGTAVTQTQAATAAWDTPASSNILLDLMAAKATVEANDMGYECDTVITTDLGYARIVADQNIIAGLTRESANSPTASGDILTIAGMRILASNNLIGATHKAFVLDSSMLGGLAYERLESPEYAGDPANGVESWTRRDPAANDQWIVRGRRPVVPVIQEPKSACAITGTTGT